MKTEDISGGVYVFGNIRSRRLQKRGILFMNYEQFIAAVITCAEEKGGGSIAVERQQIMKNNGVSAVGIAVRRQGEAAAPVIYPEELYEQYRAGESIENLTEVLLEVAMRCPRPSGEEIGEFLDFEKIRDRIVYRVISAEKNEELLQKVPYLPVLDLAIVFYLMVPEGTFQNCSVLIRKEHMKFWKIPITAIYEAARKNTPALCPCVFMLLSDFWEEEPLFADCPVFVLTNEQGVNGASALLYPHLPGIIREKLGENYFLIPSSVHEFLIVPEHAGFPAEQLAAMVKEINATELEKEDVLSDRIYYFNGDNITEM